MSSCDRTTNNKYFSCPALMSDGRGFTDYRPRCDLENQLRIQNGITNSYQYRQFLINNGVNLMQTNAQYNQMKNGCTSCNANQNVLQNQSVCVVNSSSSVCQVQNPNGLGQQNVGVLPQPKGFPTNMSQVIDMQSGMGGNPMPVDPFGSLFANVQ